MFGVDFVCESPFFVLIFSDLKILFCACFNILLVFYLIFALYLCLCNLALKFHPLHQLLGLGDANKLEEKKPLFCVQKWTS